ncbi:nuclear transport factor 2 family protein [Hymenobacter rubripertinctus]|uniref:Nuclear transport factor 2 family protein n=1 Tax=Hymenobacter rubripertinctus TaxID=2029981 RepID=A0A418QZ08_9BACT|nr:nuclear transport factor 2 family protein [Hymenobacter rubripertinctus]RIY10391.1 nuclear transport factor 2 family protein [Hymenobacter rubripertinctus]
MQNHLHSPTGRNHFSRLSTFLATVALAGSSACTTVKPPAPAVAAAAKASVSPELYRTIARLDSAMFVAFNEHDADKLQTYFAEDLEFYHDKGGLSDFRQTMDAFRRMFDQNKTTGLNRQLVPGTLEVFPINGYGAVETYEHRFCHVENGRDDCGTFKNLMVWRLKEGRWQVTRVVSYGH